MDYPYFSPPSRPETPQQSASNAANEETTATSPKQSLDEEVASVLAGLGSFWGKVRKQSANVLKDAEKQVEQYTASARPFVEKARENIDHFSENARAELTRLSQTNNDGDVIFGADGTPIVLDDVAPTTGTATSSSDKGKARAVDEDNTAEAADDTPTPAEVTLAFLGKLQSQVAANPNVQELSKNLSTIQSSVSNNLSQLPHSLQSNLEQLQTQFAHIDLADGQKVAESYLHKGEHWFQEFSQEVTKLAKEAVTIVPPSSSTTATRSAAESTAAIGRREMLLAALRNSTAAILVDPAQPPSAEGKEDTRESFAQFLQAIEDDGGVEGESWLGRIREETRAVGDKGLTRTFTELVPNTLSAEAFWTRYFFRVAQIERDDANRRRVLESSTGQQADDDFSWDADEDDAPTTTTTATTDTPSPATTRAPATVASKATTEASSSSDNEWGQSDNDETPAPPTIVQVPQSAVANRHQRKTSEGGGATSPRASSDGTAGSYDVVNAASGAPSEVARSVRSSGADEEEEDSDWE